MHDLRCDARQLERDTDRQLHCQRDAVLPARPDRIERERLGKRHPVCTRAGGVLSNEPYTLLFRDASAATQNASYGGGGTTGVTYKNTETVASTTTTVYTARAQRFFNGETIRVQSDGQICDLTFRDTTTNLPTNPPSFKVQQVSTGCGADVAGAVATFRWGGVYYDSSGNYCNGIGHAWPSCPATSSGRARADPFSDDRPWLSNEFPLDTTGRSRRPRRW